MSFFEFKQIFKETYGITDYMSFLIRQCSKTPKEMEDFIKLHQKYVFEKNIPALINLLIKIGGLLEKMEGQIVNALLTYGVAMEKCIFKYDKRKIDLSIKCAKINEILSKKQNPEKYNEIDDDGMYGMIDEEIFGVNGQYNLRTDPRLNIFECEFLTSSIIMYNIAVDVLEHTQDNPQKLINILLDIAKIQKKQNKHKDAIETLNKCLRVSINLQTISHPDTLFIITELAYLHLLISKFGQSFKYYNTVFKYQNIENPNYTQTIQLLGTMISLGHVSFCKGNCIEAIDYYTNALKKSEGIIEPTNNVIVNILTFLSISYIYYNKPEKALKYKQILIERGFNTMIIDETYKKYNFTQKFCACCYQIKEKLFLCSGCHKVHYCNREHQIKDWSNHKLFCLQEKSKKIKFELLKPKFMALTNYPHPNDFFGTIFYMTNRSLYKRAVQGDAYSMAQFASLCHNHSYHDQSFKWFSKLAVRGNISAQYYIGLSYLYGKGIHINISEAIKWLLLAANKYHADAQYELGILYLNINNSSEGVGWIKLAAVQKHKIALEMLENLGVDI